MSVQIIRNKNCFCFCWQFAELSLSLCFLGTCTNQICLEQFCQNDSSVFPPKNIISRATLYSNIYSNLKTVNRVLPSMHLRMFAFLTNHLCSSIERNSWTFQINIQICKFQNASPTNLSSSAWQIRSKKKTWTDSFSSTHKQVHFFPSHFNDMPLSSSFKILCEETNLILMLILNETKEKFGKKSHYRDKKGRARTECAQKIIDKKKKNQIWVCYKLPFMRREWQQNGTQSQSVY